MAERREEDRIEVCLDAVWDGTMGKYSARITDLSEGGCYIDSLCEAYVGEVIQFNMQLPTGEWLELSGEIAHHVPQIGFGVRFVNLSDSNRQKLISILSGPSGPREDLSPGKTS
ncbi:MAG TPA: PilZ domain-containing protein [Pyrinomonadaceae bacterium]|nr:PilZ domain-containing protein [Pyrinomonadaceae bacterium]